MRSNASQLRNWLAFYFLNSWCYSIRGNVIRNCSRQNHFKNGKVSAINQSIKSIWRVLRMTSAFDYFGLIQSNRWAPSIWFKKYKTPSWITRKLRSLFLKSLTDWHYLWKDGFLKLFSLCIYSMLIRAWLNGKIITQINLAYSLIF